jgi:hypothetical protein
MGTVTSGPKTTTISTLTLANLIPDYTGLVRPPLAYTYKAAKWHNECVAAKLYEEGKVNQEALTNYNAEGVVNWAIKYRGYEPEEDWMWDSDNLPKEVGELSHYDECDLCREVIDPDAPDNPNWE